MLQLLPLVALLAVVLQSSMRERHVLSDVCESLLATKTMAHQRHNTTEALAPFFSSSACPCCLPSKNNLTRKSIDEPSAKMQRMRGTSGTRPCPRITQRPEPVVEPWKPGRWLLAGWLLDCWSLGLLTCSCRWWSRRGALWLRPPMDDGCLTAEERQAARRPTLS